MGLFFGIFGIEIENRRQKVAAFCLLAILILTVLAVISVNMGWIQAPAAAQFPALKPDFRQPAFVSGPAGWIIYGVPIVNLFGIDLADPITRGIFIVLIVQTVLLIIKYATDFERDEYFLIPGIILGVLSSFLPGVLPVLILWLGPFLLIQFRQEGQTPKFLLGATGVILFLVVFAWWGPIAPIREFFQDAARVLGLIRIMGIFWFLGWGFMLFAQTKISSIPMATVMMWKVVLTITMGLDPDFGGQKGTIITLGNAWANNFAGDWGLTIMWTLRAFILILLVLEEAKVRGYLQQRYLIMTTLFTVGSFATGLWINAQLMQLKGISLPMYLYVFSGLTLLSTFASRPPEQSRGAGATTGEGVGELAGANIVEEGQEAVETARNQFYGGGELHVFGIVIPIALLAIVLFPLIIAIFSFWKDGMTFLK